MTRMCIHEVLVRWRNGGEWRIFFWHCWCVFCIYTLSHGEQYPLMSWIPVYNSQNVCGHGWPKQLMSKFTESAVHPFHLRWMDDNVGPNKLMVLMATSYLQKVISQLENFDHAFKIQNTDRGEAQWRKLCDTWIGCFMLDHVTCRLWLKTINDYVLSRFILFVDGSCCFVLFPRCLLLFHDISPCFLLFLDTWYFLMFHANNFNETEFTRHFVESNFRPMGESLTSQVKCLAPYNGTSTVVCRAYTKWDAVKPPKIW